MSWESVNQGHEAKTLTNSSHNIYLRSVWSKEQSEINPRALNVLGEDTKQRARTYYTGERAEKFSHTINWNMLHSAGSTGIENNRVSSSFEGRK